MKPQTFRDMPSCPINHRRRSGGLATVEIQHAAQPRPADYLTTRPISLVEPACSPNASTFVRAIRDGDSENEATLRVSLARSVAAFRWGANACLPGILAYANARPDADDDLFAPAFILTSWAPEHPETRQLATRLSDDVRALLGLFPIPPQQVGREN
jgi:hypothetical protein